MEAAAGRPWGWRSDGTLQIQALRLHTDHDDETKTATQAIFAEVEPIWLTQAQTPGPQFRPSLARGSL